MLLVHHLGTRALASNTQVDPVLLVSNVRHVRSLPSHHNEMPAFTLRVTNLAQARVSHPISGDQQANGAARLFWLGAVDRQHAWCPGLATWATRTVGSTLCKGSQMFVATSQQRAHACIGGRDHPASHFPAQRGGSACCHGASSVTMCHSPSHSCCSSFGALGYKPAMHTVKHHERVIQVPLMIFEARYRVLFNTLLDGDNG
jgi:hypothetical protein